MEHIKSESERSNALHALNIAPTKYAYHLLLHQCICIVFVHRASGFEENMRLHFLPFALGALSHREMNPWILVGWAVKKDTFSGKRIWLIYLFRSYTHTHTHNEWHAIENATDRLFVFLIKTKGVVEFVWTVSNYICFVHAFSVVVLFLFWFYFFSFHYYYL